MPVKSMSARLSSKPPTMKHGKPRMTGELFDEDLPPEKQVGLTHHTYDEFVLHSVITDKNIISYYADTIGPSKEGTYEYELHKFVDKLPGDISNYIKTVSVWVDKTRYYLPLEEIMILPRKCFGITYSKEVAKVFTPVFNNLAKEYPPEVIARANEDTELALKLIMKVCS